MQETVNQFLFKDCSRSLLADLAGESSYWQECETFVERNGERSVAFLSHKEKRWIIKMREDLLDEAAR